MPSPRKSKSRPRRKLLLTFAGDVGPRLLQVLWQHPDMLRFSSPGGCVYTMCACVEALLRHPCGIEATGQVFSAAVPIVAAGAKGCRFATPLARFMVHPASIVAEADRNLSACRAETAELAYAETAYADLLGQLTKKPAEWWAQKGKGVFYFGAEEALELGVIDEIV